MLLSANHLHNKAAAVMFACISLRLPRQMLTEKTVEIAATTTANKNPY
jgi:hypothetical protein